MRILVVDDESGIRMLLTRILASESHDVMTASDGQEALALLEHLHFDLVLSDVRMPGMDGLELLRNYRERKGSAPFVIMSAYGDDDSAVEAIRRGAADYLFKPFRIEQVLLVLRKAHERERLRHSVQRLSEELSVVRGDDDVIGRSGSLREVTAMARRAASLRSSVFITGEAGTGKEMVARLIHRSGPRFEHPFVSIRCDEMEEKLLDRELFGAPETADTTRVSGAIDESRGGTLFLDEILALTHRLQVKLLGVLQRDAVAEGAVGSDLRIVCATSGDPDAAMAAGTFRPDLFYALGVVRLHLPPLRERTEDIADLAVYFAHSQSRRLHRSIPRMTPAALDALSHHQWPGNVNELETTIERALVFGDEDEIRLEHVEAALHPADTPRRTGAVKDEDLSIKRQTAALEKRLIAIALDRAGGNRSRAAKMLDLSHRALLYKIREYELGT